MEVIAGDGAGSALCPERVKLYEITSGLALASFMLPAYCFLVAGVGYHLGYPIGGGHLYIALFLLLLSIIFRALVITPGKGYCQGLLLFVYVLCVLAGTILVSSWFQDISHDGPQYHQEAIIQLAHGLNPFREVIIPDVGDVSWAVWINTLPKFTWIVCAIVYKATGLIETAKFLNIYLAGCVFWFVASFLLLFNRPSVRQIMLLSALCALNPVTICQSTNQYGDAAAGSLAVIAFVAMLAYGVTRSPVQQGVMLLAACCALCAKVTIATFIAVVLLLFCCTLLKTEAPGTALRNIVLSAVGLAAGILVFAYNPYVTNYIRYANPLYPVYVAKLPMSAGTENILTAGVGTIISDNNAPANFRQMNGVEKLLHSICGESANVLAPAASRLKFPLLISVGEIKIFFSSDLRVGGFGPWFCLSLIVSVGIVLVLAVRKEFFPGILLLAVLASVIVHPGGWWARYAPQTWLLPIIALGAAWYHARQGYPLRLAGQVLAAILAVNVSLILVSYTYGNGMESYRRNLALENEFRLSAAGGRPAIVDFGGFQTRRVRYYEAGIPFVQRAVQKNYLANHILPRLGREERDLVERSYELVGIRNETANPVLYDLGQSYRLRPGISPADLWRLAGMFGRLAADPGLTKRPL